MQTAANRLLTNYGESITCTRGNSGAYDPSDLTVDASANIEYTGVGLPTNYSIDEIDGINVKVDDSLVLFYSTTEPQPGDTFKYNTIDYNVITVERIRAQGEDVFYKVQVRV